MKTLLFAGVIILIIYLWMKQQQQTETIASPAILSSVNAVSNTVVTPKVTSTIPSPVADINANIKNSLTVAVPPQPTVPVFDPNALKSTAALIQKQAAATTASEIRANIQIGVAAEKAAGNYTGFGVPLTPAQGGSAFQPLAFDENGFDVSSLNLGENTNPLASFQSAGFGSGDFVGVGL